MSFICNICGEEHSEDERSHDSICIYCDLNLVNDANIDDPQLF